MQTMMPAEQQIKTATRVSEITNMKKKQQQQKKYKNKEFLREKTNFVLFAIEHVKHCLASNYITLLPSEWCLE